MGEGGGGGEEGGGQIRDAHEFGMTSAVRSTLAVPPVSPLRISLINGRPGEERLLLLVSYSGGAHGRVQPPFKACLKK